MRMYQLNIAAKRGFALFGAVGLLAGVGASAFPAFTSADALNPLTHRSLTLSSSSPGWDYTDGSGNPVYAPPNSGANGLKTGNTFTFDVSSTQAINGLSFQYCTTAAGMCFSPGDDGYTNTLGTYTRNADTSSTSDLNIASSSPLEITSGDWTTISSSNSQVPNRNDSQGNFVVETWNGTAWAYSSGWQMQVGNLENDTVGNHAGATGKNNFMVLENETPVSLTSTQPVKVVFFGTDSNYITNPGEGSFFVKINDYNDANITGSSTVSLPSADFGPVATDIVDGGVTVANVMNQSIEIQTKVLETMDFSVGTVDPDTLTDAQLSTATSGTLTTPGQCDPILTAFTPTHPQNTLILGNEGAENSLMTSRAFATHSYFRLSSNSSGGATVYYSGSTLSNTEGDQIDPAGETAAHSIVGTEQFGLGLDTNGSSDYTPNYGVAATDSSNSVKMENGEDTDNGVNTVSGNGLSSDWTTYRAGSGGAAHDPKLFPLVPEANYGDALGGINSQGTADGNTNADVSFNPYANTVATPIATESSQVVNCVTGKVRYVANIAATTPAGIYTTKINYIASPQY